MTEVIEAWGSSQGDSSGCNCCCISCGNIGKGAGLEGEGSDPFRVVQPQAKSFAKNLQPTRNPLISLSVRIG